MKSLHIQITDRCNLQCKQCDIWKCKPRNELSLDDWKKIIDRSYKKYGKFDVWFTGGEPFLSKDFLKLVKYCTEKGLKTGTCTNATLITEKNIKQIIDSGLGKLNISLDAVSKDKIMYLRGKNILEHLKDILRKFDEYPSRPPITILTTIMGYNLDEIPKIVEMIKRGELVDNISFQPLIPNIGSEYNPRWYKKSDLFPKDIEKVDKVIDYLIKTKKETKNIICNSREYLEIIKKYFKNPENFGMKCKAGKDIINVSTTGDTLLCWEMDSVGKMGETEPELVGERRSQIAKCNKPCSILGCNYKGRTLTILIPLKEENKEIWKQCYDTWKNMIIPEDSEIVWVLSDNDKKLDEYFDEIKKTREPFRYFISNADGYKAGDLNEAILDSDSDYVAVFDCDSIPDKDFLIKGIEKLESGYDAVQGAKNIYNNKNIISSFIHKEAVHSTDKNELRDLRGENCELHGSGMMFKRESLVDVGCFPINLVEDCRLREIMKLHGKKIGFLKSNYYEEAPEKITTYLKQRSRWAYANPSKNYKYLWKSMFELTLLQVAYILFFFRKIFKMNKWGHTYHKGK